jgi:hypothetical protein
MQIEHTLLATIGILQAVVGSQPCTEKVKKSFLRRLIFLTGIIPRGRGKSPEAAVPKEQATESELRDLLVKTNEAVQKATESHTDCWWDHFAFGVLKKDDALRFVRIHNNHHLKIISDILTKN